MEISRYAAPMEETFTNCERIWASSASLSIPGSRTAEWASVRVCTAGRTGTLTLTPSDNVGRPVTGSASKITFMSIIPEVSGSTASNRCETIPPGGTVICAAAMAAERFFCEEEA